MESVLEELRERLFKIKEQGWIESHRRHDTGIGKTYEDLFSIIENNDYRADYKGVEIKSSRELSKSMVTLFTKSPKPRGINSYIRERYGYPDESGLKIIHTTVSAIKFNNLRNKYGFKLEIDKLDNKIYLLVRDLKKRNIVENRTIYYDFRDLKEIVEKKCKYILYINSAHKKRNGREYFKLKNCFLLTGLTFDRFIELLEKGLIFYDIRIGVYRSGKNRGKTHDHGSGFRFKKDDIKKVFNVEKI